MRKRFGALGILLYLGTASAHDLADQAFSTDESVDQNWMICERDIFSVSSETLSPKMLHVGESLSVPRRRLVEPSFMPLGFNVKPGQQLQLEENGVIRILQIHDNQQMVRVQYISPRLKPSDQEWPSKSELFMPRAELQFYPALVRARSLAREQILSEVHQLLKRKIVPSRFTLPDSHWALMMVQPTDRYPRFLFGEECNLQGGGLIIPVGVFTNPSWTLVQYGHAGSSSDLHCPSGAVVAVQTKLIGRLTHSASPQN